MAKKITTKVSGYKVGSIDIAVDGPVLLLDNGTNFMTVPLRLLDDLMIEMKLARDDYEHVCEYVKEGVEL